MDFPMETEDGIILPHLINAHTHCADAGARPSPGMTLEELVAPPDGLKHRYLRNTPREKIIADIRGYARTSDDNCIRTFVDFREGGADGCRMLREAFPEAFILGRPVSPRYDDPELSDILSVADGIALSSISDMDHGYIERCAEAAHKAGKPFAIHVSERIREDIEFVMSLEPSFLVHMVQATDSDLRICADEGVPVAICPRSNRFFGLTTPVGRMLDLGVEAALGTDNAMLCTPDLCAEASCTAELLKSQGHDPAEVFRILCNGTMAMQHRLGIPGSDKAVLLRCGTRKPLEALGIPGSLSLVPRMD